MTGIAIMETAAAADLKNLLGWWLFCAPVGTPNEWTTIRFRPGFYLILGVELVNDPTCRGKKTEQVIVRAEGMEARVFPDPYMTVKQPPGYQPPKPPPPPHQYTLPIEGVT